MDDATSEAAAPLLGSNDPLAPTATTPSEEEADAAGPDDGDRLTAKRALTAVNFFVETNRLEPYAAVYLVDIVGWDPVEFGTVSLVQNIAMVIFQAPAGDLVDRLRSGKKIITSLAVAIASVTTTMIVWTANFWIILFGKIVEGICATVFLPALMSLLLGISRNEEEVPKFIAVTEVSNKVGSCIIIVAAGAIAYFAYPDGLQGVFYLLGAGGLAAAFFTAVIPESAIDHDRSRQLDESEDGRAEGGAEGDAELGGVDKAAPSRYAELFRDRSMVFFAALTVTYHLANAGGAPLLAQYVAKIVPQETSLTWTSVQMIAWLLPQAFTAYLMTYVVERHDFKRIMTVAFVTVPLRYLALALLIEYFSNPWALTATQILEGVGAGVYDVMIPIVVQRMTRGTGRFGFAFGFIVAMWRIGHGASVFAGEALVHSYGYVAAFSTLGGIGLANLVVFVLFFRFEDGSSAQIAPTPATDGAVGDSGASMAERPSASDALNSSAQSGASTTMRLSADRTLKVSDKSGKSSFASAGSCSRYLVNNDDATDKD